jgi:formylglycine-generating enzyme required for sulfatase activity
MLDIPGLNKANYNNCVIWNAATGNLSAVGLNGSPSYYGTYDQAGNVAEWIENDVSFSGYNPEPSYSASKLVLGGSFNTNSGTISKYDTYNNIGIHNQNNYNSFTLKKDIGFRVFSTSNPLNLPNFVTVSGSSASDTLPQSRLYGITEQNLFFEVIPEKRACSLVFGTGTTFQKSPCNALAFNFDKGQIYFTFDGHGGDPSGLYWWNTNSTNPRLDYIASSNSYLTTSIGNADYYASGYWYFTEGTKTLNKISFSYAGSSNVPTATGKQTWNISLPILDTDNRFGDIAIDKYSGMLYASTASNTFYAINLLPTTTGGSPVFIKNAQLSGPGTSPAVLQLAMNYDGSILYGHHRDRKEWYTIDKDISSEYFGKVSILKTVDDSSNFLTPGFRDISGNFQFFIRSISSNFKVSALEVTNKQYVDFLNAVDPGGLLADESDYYNSYGQLASRNSGLLYHSIMSNTTYGGIGFDYNDTPGSKYAVLENMENKPVNYVSAFMAMRYCNWLHNRVDNPNTTTIDTGAYDFVSNVDGIQFNISRSANARYYLPSRREWYKAAYYSDNLNTVQKWSYINDNPWGDSATLPVLNLESVLPLTTGWKILTNGIWSTVTGIN